MDYLDAMATVRLSLPHYGRFGVFSRLVRESKQGAAALTMQQ